MKSKKKAGKPAAKRSAKKSAAASPSHAEMMKAWEKAMTPAQWHAKLEPIVGTFATKTKVWMAPGAPPQEGAGTSKHRWVLGGRFVEQNFRGKMMGMPFQGLGYTGYDNVAKRYIGTWMDNMGTGIMSSAGVGKPSAKKMELVGTVLDHMSKKPVQYRSVVRIKDRERHTFEMYCKAPGKPEYRNLLVEYTRK